MVLKSESNPAPRPSVDQLVGLSDSLKPKVGADDGQRMRHARSKGMGMAKAFK